MRKLMIPAAVLALAGCAVQPAEPRPSFEEVLPQLSAMDVCEAALYAPPEYSQAAQAEANARGLNCRDLAAAVAQHRAARSQPQPTAVYPMTPRRTCRTTQFGVTSQTSCL